MDLPPPPAAADHRAAPAGPDWAKDAVWYQVFPERFRNGDTASDPRAEDTGAGDAGWRVSPWGMEWYGRDTWEESRRDDFFATVFSRRFGGDLVGLRQQLPYLQDLGINAIYLNPVFMAPSLHKYDASSYHHIDPTFGPDREGDLRALAEAQETEDPATWTWTAADRYFVDLVAEIHARGMRVIIDGVFNHSGQGLFAFRDLRRNGRSSRYADWYQVTRWNDDGSFDFASWDGGGMLPSFGRGHDTLNPGIKQYLFDITRRWMDPNDDGNPADGVDGWRLDVAFCVPHGFWREWHALVRAINPAAYTTGEIVGPAQDWLKPDEFGAVMNYEWTYPTISFFTPGPASIAADEFRRRIDRVLARHPYDTILGLQNLLDSHDTGRILTLFESGCPPFTDWGSFFGWPKVADNPALRTAHPGPAARRALQLAAVWQMTGPGAPMLYYGTEVGMWGANDPCDRQPMLWADLRADDETMGFRGPLPQRHRRAPDMELHGFYRRLLALRHAQPALRRGVFRWCDAPAGPILVYEREVAGDVIWCAVNKSNATVELSLPRGGVDLWMGDEVAAGIVRVEEHGFRIVRLRAGQKSTTKGP